MTSKKKAKDIKQTEKISEVKEQVTDKGKSKKAEKHLPKIKAKEKKIKSETVTAKKKWYELDLFATSRKDLPEIRIGDVIRVFYKVVEGGKERSQIFEGIIIARKKSGSGKTITVRKTSFGIAVERIFPLHSKFVSKIEVKRHSKVRRAKLYYLRDLKGKAARLKELR